VPIIEGQGIWIEIAPDGFRRFRVRRQVRQVHTVKKARLDGPREEIFQDGVDPFCRALPIKRDTGFPVMLDCNSGPAMQDCFAHGRDRSRVMNIRAEIRTMIDPAKNPFRIRNYFE